MGARRPSSPDAVKSAAQSVFDCNIQRGVARPLSGLLQEKTQRSASAEPVTFRARWDGRSPELEAVGVVADKDLGQ